jgi:hypothetical protein
VSPNLEKLLPTLVGAGVEFIIVGGVAGNLARFDSRDV